MPQLSPDSHLGHSHMGKGIGHTIETGSWDITAHTLQTPRMTGNGVFHRGNWSHHALGRDTMRNEPQVVGLHQSQVIEFAARGVVQSCPSPVATAELACKSSC